mgnify:CR=1 FL=1|jgi:hypothetical protein
MKKQELIKAVIELPVDCSGSRPKIDKLTTLELTKLLDEPEKIKIPQEVADYIEFKKANNFHVYGAMRVIEDHYDKRVPEWFYEDNVEKFCLAWILGYDVEEEKRYLVRIIGITNYNSYLNYHKGEDKWTIESRVEIDAIRTKHTRKELEDAGFSEVFNSPLFEVEEVE